MNLPQELLRGEAHQLSSQDHELMLVMIACTRPDHGGFFLMFFFCFASQSQGLFAYSCVITDFSTELVSVPELSHDVSPACYHSLGLCEG